VFFYIIKKLGNDKFFSFQVGFNFLIKACFYVSKILWKNFENFFIVFLLQINIFNFIFKYIEIESGCAARLKENILNWILPRRTHSRWVLSLEWPKIALGPATARPVSFGSCCCWTHQPWVLPLTGPNAFNFVFLFSHVIFSYTVNKK
jgi:hypothetical protein